MCTGEVGQIVEYNAVVNMPMITAVVVTIKAYMYTNKCQDTLIKSVGVTVKLQKHNGLK